MGDGEMMKRLKAAAFFVIATLIFTMLPANLAIAEETAQTPAEEAATFTFVKQDGSEETVQYDDPTVSIGLNGTPGQTGFWIFKSYFVGWSDNKNYATEGTGHLFYEDQPVSDILKANIKSGTKLYALYANTGTVTRMGDLTTVRINDNVSGANFVSPGLPKKVGDMTTVTYGKDDGDYAINELHGNFSINPFIASSIYKDPWVGALENGSDWSALGKNKGNVTVVDLHVDLDKRIVLPEEFEITFHSYTFRPYSVYSATKADGTPVGNDEVYPYLGVDLPGGKAEHGVLEKIEDNNPNTTFKARSYILDEHGEKVPVHNFVIRTRIRTGYDNYGNKIKPLTMEQIQSDMELSVENANFVVPHAVAKDIADGKAEPIKINGVIDGLVKGVYFGPINSKDEILTFERQLEVNFINEGNPYATVKVENGKTINGDALTDESMPNDPTKAGYTFKEWNTQADGKGTSFTGETIVNDDMTVYAIYSMKQLPLNSAPVLEVEDKVITAGDALDLRTLITKAEDKEDGANLKTQVVIDAGNFDHTVVGQYEITYTLTDSGGASITKKATVTVNPKAMVINHAPMLVVEDKAIIVGDVLELSSLIVKAEDKEDGANLKAQVVIDAGDFDHTAVGQYEITYTLTDTGGASVTKKATVTVNPKAMVINHAPTLVVEDKTITAGEVLDLSTLIIKAEDKEDGPDLKDQVTIDPGDFDNTKFGTYEVTYTLTDHDGATVTKTATITVNPKVAIINHAPILEVEDKTITVGDALDLEALIVKAADEEDGQDLRDQVVIDEGHFNNKVPGQYEIIYTLTDHEGATITKKAVVTVVEKAKVPSKTNENKSTKEPAHTEFGKTLPKTGINIPSLQYAGLLSIIGVVFVVASLIKKEEH